MSKDVSHPLVRLLCNGLAARAPRPHPRVALGSSRPQAASENVKVTLSAASRKATRPTVALRLGTKVDQDEKAQSAAVGG